jgi:3-hydroxyisobutyrate dehydrogenase-like beta-hydroxyacid dehydrogenase
LLTPSPQARANAAHEENRIAAEARQLSTFVDAVSSIDPDYARKLARDLDFSRHPGD